MCGPVGQILVNPNRKIYTRQQIDDHVQTIQKYSDELVNPTNSSCFYPFKQMTKLFRNLRTKPLECSSSSSSQSIEYKSPFIFGGDTLQWIALPSQIESHIYENDFFY